MLRKIFSIASIALLLVGSGALVGFTFKAESNATFSSLDVDVVEIDGVFFVDAESVRQAILRRDSIVGSPIKDFSLRELKGWIKEIPAVDQVNVYPGLDRTLRVDVTQRKPLARWHNTETGSAMYIDTQGDSLPLSPHYTARVPVIHASNFASAQHGFRLVELTHEDPIWSAFIDQIEVNEADELLIIPRIGAARIKVGNLDELNQQLDNLIVFYREQIARGNLNAYKHIDLSFEGQVVAQRYY